MTAAAKLPCRAGFRCAAGGATRGRGRAHRPGCGHSDRTHISGYKSMPPLGACMDCNEKQYRALIEFMSGAS